MVACAHLRARMALLRGDCALGRACRARAAFALRTTCLLRLTTVRAHHWWFGVCCSILCGFGNAVCMVLALGGGCQLPGWRRALSCLSTTPYITTPTTPPSYPPPSVFRAILYTYFSLLPHARPAPPAFLLLFLVPYAGAGGAPRFTYIHQTNSTTVGSNSAYQLAYTPVLDNNRLSFPAYFFLSRSWFLGAFGRDML